jgi:hypothetical protein
MDPREVYAALLHCWPDGITPESYPLLVGIMCVKPGDAPLREPLHRDSNVIPFSPTIHVSAADAVGSPSI